MESLHGLVAGCPKIQEQMLKKKMGKTQHYRQTKPRLRNVFVITEKSWEVELIKKSEKGIKRKNVFKTKQRGAQRTFSLERPVEEDFRALSAISQKDKHENTLLNGRLLQPRSNLEQNRLLLS